MDENKNKQPQGAGTPGQQNTTARPAGAGGQPPQSRMEKLKERTARIRKQAVEPQEDKPLSRRQRRKRQMQDEAVEYYYDDDAAARRAGIGCLVAFLIACAIVGGILLTGWNWYKSETGGGHATANGTVQLTLGSGAGASTVGTLLEDNGLISNSMVFRLYARYLTDESPSFKAGTFDVEAGMSYDELIEALSSAEALPEIVQVQVKDGNTIMAVANTFAEAGFGTSDEFLSVANDLSRFEDIKFIAKYLEDFESNVFHPAEGLIFPDTYEFYENAEIEEIVRTLYENMNSKFTDDMYDRMGEMGWSLREFMSLASVVQAESGFVDENARVAGVFVNRLNNEGVFPNLDSDVTLRYIKQWMQWNMEEYATMTYREIDWDVAMAAVGEDKFLAYNTVGQGGKVPAKTGVPNGPICAVTKAVIDATLNPDTADGYYFFVTDAYNNYYYAVTDGEHEINVATAKEMDARFEEENAGAGTEPEGEILDDVDTDVWANADEGGTEGDGEDEDE